MANAIHRILVHSWFTNMMQLSATICILRRQVFWMCLNVLST